MHDRGLRKGRRGESRGFHIRHHGNLRGDRRSGSRTERNASGTLLRAGGERRGRSTSIISHGLTTTTVATTHRGIVIVIIIIVDNLTTTVASGKGVALNFLHAVFVVENHLGRSGGGRGGGFGGEGGGGRGDERSTVLGDGAGATGGERDLVISLPETQ